MISLRKLGLSFSLLTMCFGFINTVEGASPSKNEILLRTDAVQQSINLAGTFALDFAAAVNAAPLDQPALILALTESLTTPFTITIVNGLVTTTATDLTSLTALVQGTSAIYAFQSNLVGSFSLTSYVRSACRCRTVGLAALSYTITTSADTITPPSIIIASNQYTIVESPADVFKIQSLSSTVLNSLPFCCAIP
jgi:hypothetical protein